MTDDPPDRTGPRILLDDRQDRPVDAEGLRTLAGAVLSQEGLTDAELSISFVSEPEIEELHVRYMDEPGPTDVLSFPLDDDAAAGETRLLGDVVICPAFAERTSATPIEDELRLLLVHGILHLLGHDHEDQAERAAMWAKQERYSGVRIP